VVDLSVLIHSPAPEEYMRRSHDRPIQRLTVLALTLAILGGCSSGVARQPVGVAGLPPTINVAEWPFWIDIPVEAKDYDRIWRTTLDVTTERHAISVMDKESGYVRTEWRTNPGQTEESRYTFRIRPQESKIRMGVEVRALPSQRFATVLNNTPATPWTAVYNELRDRLTLIR
jgi:hypothetical protein